MQPFWVFAGMDMEASGGVADLVGRFETLDDAISGYQTAIKEYACSRDWYQIVDVRDGTVHRHNFEYLRLPAGMPVAPDCKTIIPLEWD